MTRTPKPCNSSSRLSASRGDRRPRTPRRAGLLALGLALACAYPPRPHAAGTEPAAAEWILPDRFIGTQHLYRITVGGPRAAGSGRLSLVLAASDRYLLKAADALGRGLWTFEVAPGGWLLAEVRDRRYCQGSEEPVLPDVDLGVLPPESLPSVLLGFLPLSPTSIDESSAALDWRDAAGRRWTARSRGARVVAWTLWRDDRPLAWWTRTADGGILSHRNGLQMRWHEVAAEPGSGPVDVLVPPAGYRETQCDELDLPELRQDQHPSPGGGSSS